MRKQKPISIPTRQPYLILAFILLIGLTFRFLYLLEIVKTPFFDTPLIDASFNDYWARGVATGQWILDKEYPDPQLGNLPYYKFPGYPWFLAAVYWIFGHGYLAPRIVQLALGLLNCGLLFSLAKKWFGERPGLIAAAFMSFYWVFIYYEGELYDPVLIVFLSIVVLYFLSSCIEKLTFSRCFASGMALGCFALVRSNILLFVPLAAGWIFWLSSREPRGSLSKGLLGLSLGMAIMIVPVTFRNIRISGDFVPLSSYGGFNLYVSNNKTATGVNASIPDMEEMLGLDIWTPYHYPMIVKRLEAKLGRPLKPSEASGYWFHQALQYAKDHPKEWFALTAKKFALLWGPAEVGDPAELNYARLDSNVLKHLPGNFAFLLSAAIIGMSLLFLILAEKIQQDSAFTQDKNRVCEFAILVILFVFAYACSLLPFIVLSRYRIPLLPCLMLFAAFGLYKIAGWFYKRRLKMGLLWLGLWVALYTAAHFPFVKYHPNEEKWREDWAYAYMKKGETDPAIRSFREILLLNPKNADAHNNLAALLLKKGLKDEALRHWDEAIRLNPMHVKALNNIGVVLNEQGNVAEAERLFKNALKFKPDYTDAHDNYGILLAKSGRFPEAEKHFEEALKLNPAHARAYGHLGFCLASRGNNQEAVRRFQKALELAPEDAELHNNLGAVYDRMGDKAAAIRHFYRAVQLDTRYVPARENLERLRRNP